MVELEPAQVEAWVSGLLAGWRSDLAVPDPSVVDRDLLERCVAAASPDALLICRSLEVLTPAVDAVAAGAVASLERAGVARPESATAIGQATAGEAWIVEAIDGPSDRHEAAVIVGFIHPDSTEHVVLADLETGLDAVERLAGLRLDGSADGLLPTSDVEPDVDGDEEEGPSRHFDVSSVAPSVALQRIAAAWSESNRALPGIEPLALDQLLVNQLVVGARLRSGLGEEAPSFLLDLDQRRLLGAPGVGAAAADVVEPVEPVDAETAAANAASLRTLRAALRSRSEEEGPAAMVAVVATAIDGSITDLAPDEAEAIDFLEWADWLGVLIGLVRGGPGTEVTPSSMVDLINRCPEVSSTIPKADRRYIEFGFSVVLDLWTQASVISDGELTADGHRALLPAAVQAWGTTAA